MEELFCITLDNITKQDVRFYCKTYGLVYKPNRRNNKSFDLAGDEDSVREMLEDYIGRYAEIGKIMDEGWYVPEWQQDDFIDPNDTRLRRVGDSDPWHELAHYVLIFEDGHRETDTLPIYVKDQCSSKEEIIDMLQDYYEDKIVDIKQVGWSRMGDSKKIKDAVYVDYNDNGGPFKTLEDLEQHAYDYNLEVKVIYPDYISMYCDQWVIKGARKDIEAFIDRYYNKDQKEYITDSKKKVKDEDVIYYGLFQRGGSIGQNANAEYSRYGDGILLKVYTDKEQAKEDAKRYRKTLTPGERSYYGMGYTVKPLYKSDLKNEYVKKLISDLGDNTIKDSKKVKDTIEGVVSESAREALEEYTQWYGIIGYDDDIIEAYESGCAYVDDEYNDYEDSYDALDAYLKWEGILGYTDAIYDILTNGVESVYYDDMLRDKEEY